MSSAEFGKIFFFYRQRRRMPSYAEIAKMFGFRSTNAAYKLVERLRKKGLVERDDEGFVIPGHVFDKVFVLNSAEMKFPSPGEARPANVMSIDEHLIRNKSVTYAFRVSDNSMINANIKHGDVALVERGRLPIDGDIVLLEVNRKWTLKYFRRKKREIWFESGNGRGAPIYPDGEVEIPAVLVAVMRSYYKT